MSDRVAIRRGDDREPSRDERNQRERHYGRPERDRGAPLLRELRPQQGQEDRRGCGVEPERRRVDPAADTP